MTTSAPRKRMSDRAEKATRLSVASILCAIPGFAALITETEWLGYLSMGILLSAVLAGPVIERVRHRAD